MVCTFQGRRGRRLFTGLLRVGRGTGLQHGAADIDRKEDRIFDGSKALLLQSHENHDLSRSITVLVESHSLIKLFLLDPLLFTSVGIISHLASNVCE